MASRSGRRRWEGINPWVSPTVIQMLSFQDNWMVIKCSFLRTIVSCVVLMWAFWIKILPDVALFTNCPSRQNNSWPRG